MNSQNTAPRRRLRRIAAAAGIFIGAIVLIVGIYLLYVMADYSRIEDKQPLAVSGQAQNDSVRSGESYTAVTQNLGFGAYTADFTFFMDGGKQSRAASAKSVTECITAGAEEIRSFDPDFVFLQEVDTDSDRSYHIDESAIITGYFPGYTQDGAVNYHSAYLFWPLYEPHGASNSEILTLSRYTITSALRRSLPIAETMKKFLDLDRCYSVSRVPCEDGHELVLYNTHMSAYGGSEEIRTAQMTMLFQDMWGEYMQGNYVVCGGDFNHDFTGSSVADLNGDAAEESDWAMPFPEDLLPDGLSRALNFVDGSVPSCRSCDAPYTEDSFTYILDGFIVSDNITVDSVEIVDTGFVYSDHNPVVLRFTLGSQA